MAEAVAKMQSPKETCEILYFWVCPHLFNLTLSLQVRFGGAIILLFVFVP